MSEEATDIDDRWSSYHSSSRKESELPWRSKVCCIASFVYQRVVLITLFLLYISTFF